jgi:hypothetical protein
MPRMTVCQGCLKSQQELTKAYMLAGTQKLTWQEISQHAHQVHSAGSHCVFCPECSCNRYKVDHSVAACWVCGLEICVRLRTDVRRNLLEYDLSKGGDEALARAVKQWKGGRHGGQGGTCRADLHGLPARRQHAHQPAVPAVV